MNSMQSMNEIKKRLESIQASRLKIDCEHQQVIATLSAQKNQNSQKVAGRHQQKEQAIQTAYNSRIHENERLIRSLQINIEGFRKCLSEAAFSEALNRTIGDACVDLSRLEELMANIQDTSLAGGIKRTLRKNGMKSREEMMADYVSLATTYVTILQREVNKLKSDCFQEITQIKNRANQEQSQSDNYLQNKYAEEEQRYKRLINANQEELVKLFNSDLCKKYGARLNITFIDTIIYIK